MGLPFVQVMVHAISFVSCWQSLRLLKQTQRLIAVASDALAGLYTRLMLAIVYSQQPNKLTRNLRTWLQLTIKYASGGVSEHTCGSDDNSTYYLYAAGCVTGWYIKPLSIFHNPLDTVTQLPITRALVITGREPNLWEGLNGVCCLF